MIIRIFFVVLMSLINFQIRAEWLKGDLHTHSTYSDGSHDIAEVINAAKSTGLDFFAITDHDTLMNGEPYHWFDPAYKDDKMILLYGIEWTTLKGHANIFSDKIFDYQRIWRANQDQNANQTMIEAHNQNAIFSINHPEMMFGLKWDYDIFQGADSIEIWNGVYRLQSRNAWSITKIWDEELMSGRRITGIGGSDTHQLDGLLSKWKNIATPTTWVDSVDRDGKSILEAIKKGRVSLSYAVDAPMLEFLADVDNKHEYTIKTGDNIISRTSIDFKIRIHYPHQEKKYKTGVIVKELASELTQAFEDGSVDVVKYLQEDKSFGKVRAVGVFKNGKLFKTWKINEKVNEIVFSDQLDKRERSYYRVELVGKPSSSYFANVLLYGKTIALTNPIYVNY